MLGGFRLECACCGNAYDESEMHLLSDGQAVCDDCYGCGEALECEACGELFLSVDLTEKDGKFYCNECLAREGTDALRTDGTTGHIWTQKDLDDLFLGRQTAYNPGESVDIRWPSYETGAEYQMTLTVDGQGRIAEISPVTGRKAYRDASGGVTVSAYPTLSENYAVAMACIRQILAEQKM